MSNKMLGSEPALRTATHAIHTQGRSGVGILPKELFLRFLRLEQKRTNRSGRPFVLLIVEGGDLLKHGKPKTTVDLISAIVQCTRDTDLVGWYDSGETIGVIFTEIGDADDQAAVQALSSKVSASLYAALTLRQINEVRLSFHVFPEDWDDDDQGGPSKSSLHMMLDRKLSEKRTALGLKRLIDIAGSILGLILCLPLFLLIGLAIKLNSKGPVFFHQVRLGQYGRKFTFLKFRSMYANNDHKIHEEYVKSFIKGTPGAEQASGDHQKLYKLAADPRITPVGRFLRNTSLDELPQFLNVLWGDMSLVGPRPPVTYEFSTYDHWHKQRLMVMKPGLTGLWQVDGRSRVNFDDMVRLDIRYARMWSLGLDIKILLRTPRAVLSGNGAC